MWNQRLNLCNSADTGVWNLFFLKKEKVIFRKPAGRQKVNNNLGFLEIDIIHGFFENKLDFN